MSVQMRESIEDDIVIVDMANMSLERRDQRSVMGKIILKDDSIIEIFDRESVAESIMLLTELGHLEPVIIHAEEYEPKHVRFVLKFVGTHLSNIKGFTKTDEFKKYCNMFKIEEMEQLYKVVGFFACNTALIVVSWIQYELRKRARMENEE